VDTGVVHAVSELLIEVVEEVTLLVEFSVRLVAAVVVVLEEVPPKADELTTNAATTAIATTITAATRV
jgi:hypothetical protein